MDRHPDLQAFFDKMLPQPQAKSKAEGVCSKCLTPIQPDEFKDEISRKEFAISGWCQKCQDEIFGALKKMAEEDEDDWEE